MLQRRKKIANPVRKVPPANGGSLRLFPNGAKLKRKFDYNKKKYSNPFFNHKKRKKIQTLNLSLRVKLIIVGIMVVILALIWFCFLSAYFNIDKINIAGIEKIARKDIENIIQQQINKKRFLFCSQKKLILFNSSKLAEALNEQYYFDNIDIQKKWPTTLTIELKEKTYSVIWKEDDKYYYIDLNGHIINEANPLEIKQKNYPLIDYRGKHKILNKKVEGQNQNINFIIELFDKFKTNTDKLQIECFIINDERDTIKIAISQGPKIYFNIKKDIDRQINKLLTLINEKLKDDFDQKTYIDLRFGDRIYYR